MLHEHAELRQLQSEVRYFRKWADMKYVPKATKYMSKDECFHELDGLINYIQPKDLTTIN